MCASGCDPAGWRSEPGPDTSLPQRPGQGEQQHPRTPLQARPPAAQMAPPSFYFETGTVTNYSTTRLKGVES